MKSTDYTLEEDMFETLILVKCFIPMTLQYVKDAVQTEA